MTIKNHPDFDIEGLAKAAVNGDEHALDMFSNWRPKTTARKFRIQEGSDNHAFYVGTQAGNGFKKKQIINSNFKHKSCLKAIQVS